jgi:phosphatidylglycerophosphate synthase
VRAPRDPDNRMTTTAQPKHKLPLLLWPPNLLGYVRVLTLIAAMGEADSSSSYAVWMLTISLVLDYFDGPCARHLGMCSQFGDLLDHYTDHVTMMWLVWVTAGTGIGGQTNLAISAIHNGVAFVYMALRGHYFKHSERGNLVTRTIEANNYWNFASMLYCANCILLPLLKLSFASTYSMQPREVSTPLVDLADALGAGVTLSYSLAVWL